MPTNLICIIWRFLTPRCYLPEVMQNLPSMSSTEALFIERAEERLPLLQAKITRSQSGVLVFQWDSPCKEVGALSVYVYDQKEIMLSSNIFHTHHERWENAIDGTPEDQIWAKLVDAAIAEIEAIMQGKVAFTTAYDSDGNVLYHGSSPTEALKASLGSVRKTFRKGNTKQAFNWFGEVTNES